MAGRDDGAGPDLRVGGNPDGVGPVEGRDAGGDAFARLDGDGEGGGAAGEIPGHHWRQAQAIDLGAIKGQADEAAGLAGHEGDGIRRDEAGGSHQIALVFAVLVVDEQHHAAGT